MTATLNEALLTLRHADKLRTLWIDQLCINQDDLQERGNQVKIMHLIYKRAVRTVVFLSSGEGHEPSKTSLSVPKLFLQLRRAYKHGEGDVLKEFQSLFSHLWFQRVWILQEIGMSDVLKVKVYYKGKTVKWDMLSLAATLLGAYSPGCRYDLIQLPPSVPRHAMIISKWTALGNSGYSHLSNIDRYGKMSYDSNRWLYSRLLLWVEPRLAEVLQDSRFCLATDPRDKVYSLLNMISIDQRRDEFAWLLDIDYSISVVEVYTRAARYSIETEHTLEIMCFKEGAAATPNLPSWVPDWTSQRLFPLQRIAVPNNYRSQFHDAIWPNKSWMPPLRKSSNKASVASFSTDSMVLTVNAHKIDLIENISSVWQVALDSPDQSRFVEWAGMHSVSSPADIMGVKFKADRRPLGIKTEQHSICDFWLRVGRMSHTNGHINGHIPVLAGNNAQRQSHRTPYRRHRCGRGFALYREGNLAFLGFQDWLAMLLPYASVGRRVATTQEGHFLLVPPETQIEDVLYFLQGGGSLAHVLRPRGEDEMWEYIGPAYIHGLYGVKMDWNSHTQESLNIR